MTTPTNAQALTEALLAIDTSKAPAAPVDNTAKDAAIRAEFDRKREEALALAEGLGRNAATGAGSLTELAFMFADSCAEGFMTADDAAKLYVTFARAFNASRVASTGTAVMGADPEKDAKSSISQFRTFAKAVDVTGGSDFYGRVLEVRATVDEKKRVGSAYLCFVNANRGVLKLIEAATVPASQIEVTDADIAGWCTKRVNAKDAADKLRAVMDALGKLLKTEDYPGLAVAVKPLAEYEAAFALTAKQADEGTRH